MGSDTLIGAQRQSDALLERSSDNECLRDYLSSEIKDACKSGLLSFKLPR